MRPGKYDLKLYRGDTYAWDFVCYTSAGSPADLTGVTAKAEIRDKPGGTVLATPTCTVTQPNTVSVKLTTASWASITHANAAWDLQLTYADPDISIITIVAGAVTITGDVTDSVAVAP